MKNLVIADIQGNLKAFEAVLEDAMIKSGFDMIWFLGDITGCGSEPENCIDLLIAHNHIAVAGDQDLAVTEKIETDGYGQPAIDIFDWTKTQITNSQKNYLENLPLTLEHNSFTLTHGTPRQPIKEVFHPMYMPIEALHDTFLYFRTPYCAVGASRTPLICTESGPTFIKFPEEELYNLTKKTRIVLNPGSVGQPRDGDPRASYMIYDDDDETVTRRRTNYDIEATQRKMRNAGVDEILVARLEYGR